MDVNFNQSLFDIFSLIASCSMNTSKSDDYRRNCKKYSAGSDAMFDLPPEFDDDLPNLGTVKHFWQN